jgi:hypothetical protein
MKSWTETRNTLITAGIPAERLPAEWGWGIDLSGADLFGADLFGANLRRANLSDANLSRANLSRADLFGADLFGADLFGADLFGADLFGADLSGANLSGANLSGANLRRANLSGANLSGANLRRANLSGAGLRGAMFNWQSHDLSAEVLRQAAGDDVQRRMLAGLILVSRNWCWNVFLAAPIDPALREWGLSVLRGYVRPGDNAPEALTAAPTNEATPPAA